MTTQRLRAVVTLGGAVDNSLGSMTREFEQNTRRMNREVGSLSRQQERLANRIKKAVLAGKDTSQLTREYQRLSVRIKNAADEAQRLSDLSERGARANQRLSDSFRQSATAAGGLGAATAGFSALMTMTNRQTADMEGIAAGYDVSLDTYKVWDGIMRRMGDGFDGTKFGDLLEELSNKFGEFKNLGEESAFDEVAKALSLDTDKMKGMETYEQYMYIMDKLSKVGDKQQAATLADKLFGADGNRIIMFLRNQGISLDDIYAKQEKLMLLTDEGREGAKKYNAAWSAATSAFGSAWEEVSGIVGGEVAPMLEKVTADFVAWFSDDANKKDLVETLKEAGRQLRQVGGVIVDIALATNSVAQAFGGWGNVATYLAVFMGGKLVYSIGAGAAAMIKMTGGLGVITSAAKAGIVAMKGFRLAALATPLGIFVGLGTLAYTVWENWEWLSDKLGKLWSYLSEKWNSIFGDSEVSVTPKTDGLGVDSFENNAASRIMAAATAEKGSVTNTVGEIHVHTKEGQSPESFGRAIYQQFTSQQFHDKAEAY